MNYSPEDIDLDYIAADNAIAANKNEEKEFAAADNAPSADKTEPAPSQGATAAGSGGGTGKNIIQNTAVGGPVIIIQSPMNAFAEKAENLNRNDGLLKKYNTTVQISRSALDAIIETVGSKRAETGGMLLGPENNDNVTHFIFDEEAAVTSITYSPSFEELTVLCELASENGYTLKGFCHSHPYGHSQPSYGDMEYVRKFFKENENLEIFYIPIVCGAPIKHEELKKAVKADDYQKFINFYIVRRDNQYQFYKAKISIEEDRICDYSKYQPIFPSTVLPKSVARIRTDAIEKFIGQRGIQVEKKSVKIAENYIGCILATGAGFDITMLLPAEFPVLPPYLIVAENGGAEYQCAIDDWNIEKSELPEKVLARIINGICRRGVKKSISLE